MADVIRVAVIDNDPLVTVGLRALVQESGSGSEAGGAQPPIRVVVAASAVEEYLATGIPADVVLLDLELADGSDPVHSVQALRATGAQVLMISVHGELRRVWATTRAGAAGYLIKDNDGARLVAAIRAARVGEQPVTTELMSLIHQRPPELSPQEHEVLRYYGTGSTLAATARHLELSISTVRTYLDRIREKWAAMGEPVADVSEIVDVYSPRDERPAASSDG